MSLVKTKKHNEGYSQGYEDENVSFFEDDVLCLKSAFREAIEVWALEKEGRGWFEGIEAHLEVMKNSVMFCAAGVVIIVEQLKFQNPISWYFT